MNQVNPNNFILYRNMPNEDLLLKISLLLRKTSDEVFEVSSGATRADLAALLHECLNGLCEGAAAYGFEGNLWHTYLTYLMVNHENAYSCGCEIRGSICGSINELALHDFGIFRELFSADLRGVGEKLGVHLVDTIENYTLSDGQGRTFNKLVKEQICNLASSLANAKDTEDFKGQVTSFYGHFGVGKFGLHKAFRLEHTEGKKAEIVPITNVSFVELSDLIGYESAKQKLIENTEAFVHGRKANNCLLYGDAGTGKSSSIKAMMNQYYDEGLRIIEIYKHEFKDLNEVIAQIKNRNYRFIIYMDDLSFEEFEIEYKYLKAVIEGGLEKKPDNVLIYATSNRRHLIRESFRDKKELNDDVHTNDTVQEKLSLAARFGVQIYFPSPEKKEFMNIVSELAKKNGIHLDEEELLLEANKWELQHGGYSGRTAQQFIDYLQRK